MNVSAAVPATVATSAPRRTPYTTMLRTECARQGRPEIDPRQVEAYLRLAYRTLDHLTADQFRREIRMSIACIDADPQGAEGLATSYGL